MNNEKLILESLRMLLWENWRKYELLKSERGWGLDSVESNEIVEMVKKINEVLSPTKQDKAYKSSLEEEKK